jgi:hypothetical protein
MTYVLGYLVIGIVLGSIYLGAITVNIQEEERLEHVSYFWLFIFFWPMILIAAITIRILRWSK